MQTLQSVLGHKKLTIMIKRKLEEKKYETITIKKKNFKLVENMWRL